MQSVAPSNAENAKPKIIRGAASSGSGFSRYLTWGSVCDALFFILAIGALRATFRDSQNYDLDFHVYWQAAHRWLMGDNPYAYTAADLGFVFKYPPWILPLLAPIGALPFESARIAWYGIELLCLAYSVYWCTQQGVGRRLACFMVMVFWWMIHGHFTAGQFTLVMLATALWAFRPDPTRFGWREACLAYVLSAKVFSLYTLIGMRRKFLAVGPWLSGAALVAASHAVLLGVSIKTGANGLSPIYHDFFAAASSGGMELGALTVRGQANHGFTALVLRILNVDSQSFTADIALSASLAIALGTIWERTSRELTEAERWTGWIALGLIVHPLAWHHSFVLAYPLCALSLSRAVAGGQLKWIALSLLGACCIGILIPQVVGPEFVRPLELAGVKAWGVVLAATALVLSQRRLIAKKALT